jgi:hypothetical protein
MLKLKEKLDKMCALCGVEMGVVPGIGPCCVENNCDNMDGPSVWMVLEKLTNEKQEVYIEAYKSILFGNKNDCVPDMTKPFLIG